VYLCKSGLSTYALILKNRKKNKIMAKSDRPAEKLDPLFRRVRRTPEDGIHKIDHDDSRDAVNVCLNKSYQKPRESDITERQNKDESHHTKDSPKVMVAWDQETSIKNKEMFETKEETVNKLENELVTTQNNIAQGSKKESFKLPLDPLEQDEGSFVLYKPNHDEPKKDLALQLEKTSTLEAPLSNSLRNESVDEGPGE
jgi:hypothetical protein